MAAFGSNEFNFRLPSAVAGLLTVPLVWAIATQIIPAYGNYRYVGICHIPFSHLV